MTNKLSAEPTPLSPREIIARRAALELRDGYYVNLGIGLPTLIGQFVPKGMNVVLHGENGILGIGPYPKEESRDPDLVNGGKEAITVIRGAATLSSEESFAIVRGGHLDLCFLGAMQVDEQGSIANWRIPDKLLKGMGGAMDLVTGGSRVVVTMEHATKTGEKKILRRCNLPLTGYRVVDTVITQLAVIKVTTEGLVLHELAPGVSIQDVQSVTEPRLIIPRQPTTMTFSNSEEDLD